MQHLCEVRLTNTLSEDTTIEASPRKVYFNQKYVETFEHNGDVRFKKPNYLFAL